MIAAIVAIILKPAFRVAQMIGAFTHTTVKGISHINKAVVNFNVDLVYRGNMWLHMN